MSIVRISTKQQQLFVLVLLITLLITPLSELLATTMLGHVLILIPLLIWLGFLLGHVSKREFELNIRKYNAGGIPGILLVSFTIAFWMIPRWLDYSLMSEPTAWAKYLSLVLLAGVPLAWSWDELHPITRGVVKIEFLAMLFRLGWLYLISPERFCNNYLLSDQIWLGRGMIVVGVALGLTWLIPTFFGDSSRQAPITE